MITHTQTFGILVNNLTKCFIESYSGIAQHPKLLPHAIGRRADLRHHQTAPAGQVSRPLAVNKISPFGVFFSNATPYFLSSI